ncbi:MarR family winged helix-turn-helix transcriptional regulator [Mangrovicoccus algicola]|uniref:MarR family transcriptional regulator n=1 Tax=Mangrovicoccus algicola TaxID=2771008 RepID=A0A8J6YYT0_9RHOB|nr:MarR family transcriptional regulator [Mangrovicoccus algicola]MBE3638258.1 MarR family transcriptional regulator [Mangrovicoccus algicola]
MSNLAPSPLVIQLFGELLLLDQFLRNRIAKALPEEVELSQFLVLLHLATSGEELGPARLATSFNVTRGAMSNTLGRLERAGQITMRGDTVDARRKFVSISEAGQRTLDEVVGAINPRLRETLSRHPRTEIGQCLTLLSELRDSLETSRLSPL